MTDDPVTEYDVTKAMMTYGGGFVSGLGKLYCQADAENRRRLQRASRSWWDD